VDVVEFIALLNTFAIKILTYESTPRRVFARLNCQSKKQRSAINLLKGCGFVQHRRYPNKTKVSVAVTVRTTTKLLRRYLTIASDLALAA